MPPEESRLTSLWHRRTSIQPRLLAQTSSRWLMSTSTPCSRKGESARARTGLKTNKRIFNPFLLSAIYRINNPRIRTVLKMDYFKDKNISRPQNRSVSDPFDQASELSSHSQRWGSKDRPWEAFENPSQIRGRNRSDQRGIQTQHFSAWQKTGHVLGLLAMSLFCLKHLIS